MNDVRALITGSAGFLGKHLVQKIIDKGYEVMGIDIKPSGIAHQKYQERICDITDEHGIKDIVVSSKPDVVIHSAAALAQFVKDKKCLHAINVDGTRHVLSAAHEAGTRKFIFLSSVEVYGIDVKVPCPETAPLNPVCQYGEDKVACEALCREYIQKGMNITIFRPPTIAGPGQNEPTLLGQVISAYKGKSTMLAGGGKTRLQMVNVVDVCTAILLAIDNPRSNGVIMNLGSDNVPTMREIIVALYEHAGKPVKITSFSPGVARLLVKLLHKLHLSPVEPQHLEIALRDYMFDTTLAKEILGWKPTKTDIESTIDTYDWYVNTLEHAGEGKR
ncbi:MAG: NAD-dependent epimerase/dehydratase family protein [Candidatus Sigynarchaeota archaeon]